VKIKRWTEQIREGIEKNNKSEVRKSLFVESEKTNETWKALGEKFSRKRKGPPLAS